MALEQALITRFGTLGRAPVPFLLRSDRGLVCTSRCYTVLVRSHGLKKELVTPHCPQHNGMVERATRALKERCVHRHLLKRLQHSSCGIAILQSPAPVRGAGHENTR
jgi:putative transposase